MQTHAFNLHGYALTESSIILKYLQLTYNKDIIIEHTH